MSDRPFLDTNILVYAFDQAEPQKQQRAWEFLGRQVYAHPPTISTQVIQEFYVTVVRKLAIPLDAEKAYDACLLLADFFRRSNYNRLGSIRYSIQSNPSSILLGRAHYRNGEIRRMHGTCHRGFAGRIYGGRVADF